jgi:hypothetical protein
MIYICIIRKNKERLVACANTCKFRITEKDQFRLEGPRDAYADYDITKECIFFTTNDQTVIDFIKNKPINTRDVEFLNDKKKWSVNPTPKAKK